MISYIACDDLNFDWSVAQVTEFDRLWSAGVSVTDIARKFHRKPDEVALLIIDRARKGRIQARPGGVFGAK